MPDFDVWDVIKVPFPYVNRPVVQRRPALVIARFDEPGLPALLWVLMITSAANRSWPADVPISDLSRAGLPSPSVVRSAKVATIESTAAERIGSLPERNRPAVAEHLGSALKGIRQS